MGLSGSKILNIYHNILRIGRIRNNMALLLNLARFMIAESESR